MTLTAGGAGREGRTAGGRPGARSPGRPIVDESLAAEDAA